MKELIEKIKEEREKAIHSMRNDNTSKPASIKAYETVMDVRIYNKILEIINTTYISKISDGYHTFEELYFHRMVLFSIICNQNKDKAWKSKLHIDGTMYLDYFIVGINTIEGQYSYHYHMEYWDYFKDISEILTAPEWDGHEPKDITRLLSLL